MKFKKKLITCKRILIIFSKGHSPPHTYTLAPLTPSPHTELYGELQFPSTFSISSAVHPSTYLNKLLLGCSQGQLQLWNIRTSSLIYTFTGWGSKVTSLAQSQAVDIVGIGLENGNVILHNLKFDETLMKFQQDWGPVMNISFRTGKVFSKIHPLHPIHEMMLDWIFFKCKIIKIQQNVNCCS